MRLGTHTEGAVEVLVALEGEVEATVGRWGEGLATG